MHKKTSLKEQVEGILSKDRCGNRECIEELKPLTKLILQAVKEMLERVIGEKTCTNIDGMMEAQIMPGFSMMTGEALKKAIEIANEKVNL